MKNLKSLFFSYLQAMLLTGETVYNFSFEWINVRETSSEECLQIKNYNEQLIASAYINIIVTFF